MGDRDIGWGWIGRIIRIPELRRPQVKRPFGLIDTVAWGSDAEIDS